MHNKYINIEALNIENVEEVQLIYQNKYGDLMKQSDWFILVFDKEKNLTIVQYNEYKILVRDWKINKITNHNN
jgi:hypothetical protein